MKVTQDHITPNTKMGTNLVAGGGDVSCVGAASPGGLSQRPIRHDRCVDWCKP